MSFESTAKYIGRAKLPSFAGIRVMMMPYRIVDPRRSLPDYLSGWFDVLDQMCPTYKSARSGKEWAMTGIGYLTIDEAVVAPDTTHRRPGLHVDGVGPNGEHGGWGGGGGYGANGMRMVASHYGCRGYVGDVDQVSIAARFPEVPEPRPNGDCEHLRVLLKHLMPVDFEAGEIWECGSLTLHESVPCDSSKTVARQFCRVSFPSNSPWYDGYTENPIGIKPDGPIHPARSEFMSYRP